jgi:hypothetical protein
VAQAEYLSPHELERLEHRYGRAGKVKVRHGARIRTADAVAASFAGSFVILAPRTAPRGQ